MSCLILDVPSDAVTNLDVHGAVLSGLTILTDAGSPWSPQAVERLDRAGAVAGISLANGDDLPSADLLRYTKVIVLGPGRNDEASIFARRTLAARARAARPDIRILVSGPISSELRAYVDGAVAMGPRLQSVSVETLIALSRDAGPTRLLVRLAAVDWNTLAAFAAERPLTSEVVAAATLTAEEIVARHQVQRARQTRIVQRTIARGSTTLMFEVPGFVAPVTVSAATVIYQQPGLTEIEQMDVRVNGSAIAGGDASTPPRLPLIEAERIATPPLAIALGDAYHYTLAGREMVDGRDAYAIDFSPHESRTLLARGRAWIDTRTFALLRLETVQERLRGAIVSSEQHDRFAPFRVGEDEVWLPVLTKLYQMYEGAGHRTPIHRAIATPDYAINPADFDRLRAAAHASPHLMLRETPDGLRYLLRPSRASDGAGRHLAPRAGERIRAAVFGVLVDPNISVPLPFAGFSYVDLNLFNTGAQLNAFVGGTYGQLSWSVPALGQSRWQAHGRAFAIAARYNDRAFRGGIEQYRENITQRPAHLSAGVVRPLFRHARVRLDYELDYISFERADTTDARFVVPDDELVHGFVSSLETESGPWLVRAWWNPAVRQNWRTWGPSDAPVGATRAFVRFGMVVARTLVLKRAASSRIEAAWMGGRHLDRFSRYSFDAFENRLRGYPTASLRYDRGAVVRTVTSWAARGWRVDAFGDAAFVKDPGFGDRSRMYPGIGAAVEVGGPWRTLWSVEWGYGFRARREDGRLGTQALRVTGFRMF